MITLHGFSASNFYNVVKHVLRYKCLPFKEDLIYSGGEEWLSISPVGKIPAITTEDGKVLSESFVICDYLEEAYPAQPLYPSDAADRGSVRQIMKITELYLETPCRRLLSYSFSGKQAPESDVAEINHIVSRGVKALKRLCKFSPWIAGDDFSMADIFVFYCLSVVGRVGPEQLQRDVLAEIDGMKAWYKAIRETEIAIAIEADREANLPEFQAYVREAVKAYNKKLNK